MSRSGDALDRSSPPPSRELRPHTFPPFIHERLDNGIRVFVARADRFPLASIDLLLPAGGSRDPEPRPGLASFHAALIDEGTAGRTSLEIAAAVEQLGGSLQAGADWDVAAVSAGLHSEHLDAGLALVAEVALEPSFPDDEVERHRRRRLAEILRRKDQPAVLAEWAFAEAVYAGTPYGHLLLGTEASLGALTRDELVAFYERVSDPSEVSVIGVGDLDPGRFVDRVSELLGAWRKPAGRPQPTPRPRRLQRCEVHLVDRPQAVQTQLQIGHAGVPRSHPDHPVLVVLNALLGGKFTSRINLNLRERHGFTYGASSHFANRRGPGPFAIRAAVATESAGDAAEQVLGELRRIRDEPVGEEELRDAQDYLVGVFPYTLQTVGDLAKRLEDLAVFELPLSYYDNYPALLGEITAEQLLAAARRHLHPDRVAIVAVGPLDKLRSQLEAFGPVTERSF